MEPLEHLQQISLFGKVPVQHMTALAGVANREQFKPGERLVVQNDLGNRFFIIDSGLVNLRRTDPDGIERSVGVVSPHPLANAPGASKSYFGEQMFTSQEPFDYNAEAVRPTQALVFYRDDFDTLVKDRPALTHMLGFVESAERKRTRGFRWVEAGESVELVARKHWWALLPGLVPVAVLLGIVLVGLFALHFILVSDILQWIALVSLVVVFLFLAWQVYDWLNDEYLVTTERIAHVERIFLTNELRESAPIDKVLGVTLERKFPSDYFGVSTVVVLTAGREKGSITFAYVGNGEKIRKLIQGQQDRLKARIAAEGRERFRARISNELRHQLMPETVAAERAAEAAQQPAPRPPRPKSTWTVLKDLIRSWLELELKEPGRVVWRKHWVVLLRQIGKWVAGIFVLDIIALIFVLIPGLQFPVYWLGGLVLLAIFVGGVVWQWEDWRNDTYAVTDSMVIDSETLPLGLHSKTTTAPLDQVQDIRVEMPGTLSFILNFGDVLIETAGQNGQMIFHSIHSPREAQEEIFRRLNDYRARRAEKELVLQSHAVVDALLAYDRLRHVHSANTDPIPPSPTNGE